MKYTEFEQKVVDTFNRMHYVNSCDDEFMIEGSDCDVQHILSSAFCSELNIKYDRSTGYNVSREALIRLYEADEDNVYPQMLDSFNDIMNRYNVVALDTSYSLHIV